MQRHSLATTNPRRRVRAGLAHGRAAAARWMCSRAAQRGNIRAAATARAVQAPASNRRVRRRATRPRRLGGLAGWRGGLRRGVQTRLQMRLQMQRTRCLPRRRLGAAAAGRPRRPSPPRRAEAVAVGNGRGGAPVSAEEWRLGAAGASACACHACVAASAAHVYRFGCGLPAGPAGLTGASEGGGGAHSSASCAVHAGRRCEG